MGSMASTLDFPSASVSSMSIKSSTTTLLGAYLCRLCARHAILEIPMAVQTCHLMFLPR